MTLLDREEATLPCQRAGKGLHGCLCSSAQQGLGSSRDGKAGQCAGQEGFRAGETEATGKWLPIGRHPQSSPGEPARDSQRQGPGGSVALKRLSLRWKSRSQLLHDSD